MGQQPKWGGSWAGGRTRIDSKGRTVYVLEQRDHDGRRYSKTLGPVSEKAAEVELAVFKKNPAAFLGNAPPESNADAVLLDTDSVQRCLDDLKRQGRSARYIADVTHYLSEWAEALVDRDLRKVDLKDYRTHAKSSRHAINALKVFTRFLREEGTLLRRDDQTLDLKLPRISRSTVVKEDAKVYTLKEIERLYRAINGWEYSRARVGPRALSAEQIEEVKTQRAAGVSEYTLATRFGVMRNTIRRAIAGDFDRGQEFKRIDAQVVRDVVRLRCCFGMHHSEIDRIARGLAILAPVEGAGEIVAAVTFDHKRGEPHKVSLDTAGVAAIQRLQVRGCAPSDSYMLKVVNHAAKALGLRRIRPGNLRHSFVTWANTVGEEVRPEEGGMSLASIVMITGHSEQTARKYYRRMKINPMAKLPLKLEHPDDPTPLPRRQLRNLGG